MGRIKISNSYVWFRRDVKWLCLTVWAPSWEWALFFFNLLVHMNIDNGCIYI
jgi:hypothetical protein